MFEHPIEPTRCRREPEQLGSPDPLAEDHAADTDWSALERGDHRLLRAEIAGFAVLSASVVAAAVLSRCT